MSEKQLRFMWPKGGGKDSEHSVPKGKRDRQPAWVLLTSYSKKMARMAEQKENSSHSSKKS